MLLSSKPSIRLYNVHYQDDAILLNINSACKIIMAIQIYYYTPDDWSKFKIFACINFWAVKSKQTSYNGL